MGYRQVFLAQEIRIEQLRLIARAVVGKDGHDGVAGAEFLGQPDGAGDIDAGRAAEAQAFVLEQVEDDRQRFFVGDLKAKSIVSPSRLAVMRPWPMPSVIEVPSALQLAVRVEAVERGAQRIGERDRDVLVAAP